jgi:Core-2/I-Branching enzyme
MVRFSSLASSILLAIQLYGLHCNCSENDSKIAFMFLSRGHIPLEDVWREFFGWNANSNHYSIYVHPQQGFKYHRTSFFYGKEISESHVVQWGGMGQVRAIKSLVREALRDPLNEWFCLMSEACIPLRPFAMWREAFQLQKKSIINACVMDPGETELLERWRPGLDEVYCVPNKSLHY